MGRFGRIVSVLCWKNVFVAPSSILSSAVLPTPCSRASDVSPVLRPRAISHRMRPRDLAGLSARCCGRAWVGGWVCSVESANASEHCMHFHAMN
jgi:hypothetical protein